MKIWPNTSVMRQKLLDESTDATAKEAIGMMAINLYDIQAQVLREQLQQLEIRLNQLKPQTDQTNENKDDSSININTNTSGINKKLDTILETLRDLPTEDTIKMLLNTANNQQTADQAKDFTRVKKEIRENKFQTKLQQREKEFKKEMENIKNENKQLKVELKNVKHNTKSTSMEQKYLHIPLHPNVQRQHYLICLIFSIKTQ